jgi:hypothetical protein
MRALVAMLCLALAAPAQAQEQPQKVVVLDFATRGLEARKGELYSDRFATFLRARGVAVTSARDVRTLLSFERQKQLLGCADDGSTCAAELTGALGTSTLFTGSVAQLGARLQLSLKLLDVEKSRALFTFSRTLDNEGQVLDALEEAAGAAAQVLGGGSAPVAPIPARAVTRSVAPWVLAAAGALVAGAGGALLVEGVRLQAPPLGTTTTPSAYDALSLEGRSLKVAGAIGLGVGAAALLSGLLWWGLSSDAPAVALWVEPGAVRASVAVRW